MSLPYDLQRVDDQLLSYELVVGGGDRQCYDQQYVSVMFGCNQNVTDATVAFVEYVSAVCGWQIYIETQYACPGMWASSSSSSSSSTGPRVTPCANGQVDLFPLSYQTDLSYMANNALFIVHPCLYVYFAECDGASLCLISGRGNVTRLVDYQPWLASSNFPLTTVGDTPGRGFVSQYRYTDNSTCIFNDNRHGQSVDVVFVCDPFAVPARLTYVSIDYLACHHTAYVNSTYACPVSVPVSSSSSSSALPYSSSSSSSSSSMPILPSSCANAQTNLSALSNQTDLVLLDASDDSFLTFHPCHPIVDYSAVPACHNSTLCRRYLNGSADVLVGWDSGWQSSNYSLSTHVLADGTSYSYYFYTDESVQCVYEGLSYPRQALVIFLCNTSVAHGAVLVSVELQQPHPVRVPCQWTVTLQTALACTGPLLSSSTGSYNPSSAAAAVSSTSSSAAVLQPSCVNEHVNLSSLAQSAPLVYAPPDGSNYLLLRPCGPLTACVDGAACVDATLATLNGTSSYPVLGYDPTWPSSSYQLVQSSARSTEPTSWQYTYVDQQQTCIHDGQQVRAQLVVRFFCDWQRAEPVVSALFTYGAPCVWYADVHTPLACSSTPSSSSTGSPPASPGSPASFDLNLLASFAVVLLSACLLIVLLIVYRVRARKLLPYSGAVAMHSPSGVQAAGDSYVPIE